MNYYDVLGLSERSEPEVIEAAYRALMKKYHPDKWVGRSAEAERKTKLINEAYAALRDPNRRREYDKKHSGQASRPPSSPRQEPQTASRAPRPRSVSQPSPQPWRVSPQSAATSAFSFSFGRSEVVGAAIVFLGVLALGGIASHGSSQVSLAGTQTLLLPPPSSVLGPGRRQVFCITNKTLHPVEYTVYWGDTEGHNYEINAGASMVHFSRLSASPMIEFTQRDEPIVGVPRKIVKARTASDGDRSCNPNYSFAYQDADISRWSQYDRFGLFRDDPVSAFPPAGVPNNGNAIGAP